jgi:hypothetical protein
VTCLSLGLVVGASAQQPAPKFAVELEGGATWQSRNDVQIPNDPFASRFSLTGLAGSGPWAAGRLYLTWQPSPRHGLRLLLAPFSLTEAATVPAPIRFAGANYVAGQPARATYTFNSYRLTYRFRVHERPRSTAWIGFTAKVRDAVVALEQGATASRKDDVGFVPLIHLAGQWRFAPSWHLSLDADAIAGGPGRAEDVAVKVGRDLGGGWAMQAGYRLVEGGADVDAVYAFAWLNSAVVSVSKSW